MASKLFLFTFITYDRGGAQTSRTTIHAETHLEAMQAWCNVPCVNDLSDEEAYRTVIDADEVEN